MKSRRGGHGRPRTDQEQHAPDWWRDDRNPRGWVRTRESPPCGKSTPAKEQTNVMHVSHGRVDGGHLPQLPTGALFSRRARVCLGCGGQTLQSPHPLVQPGAGQAGWAAHSALWTGPEARGLPGPELEQACLSPTGHPGPLPRGGRPPHRQGPLRMQFWLACRAGIYTAAPNPSEINQPSHKKD